MFIDTHAHITWEPLQDNLAAVVKEAADVSVNKIITIGCCEESSKNAIAATKIFDTVFASCGVHPSDVRPDVDWKLYESFWSEKKCVAIGETGLDDCHYNEHKNLQEELFLRHIQAAKKYNKPLVIHTREAGQKALDILQSENCSNFVIHCFTENKAFAKRVLDMGGIISVGGIITFPNAKDLRETVAYVPLSSIMLETDCPYLAPQSVRGKVNSPKNIPEIAYKIAEVKGVLLSEVEESTTRLAERFFGI
ncbi:hypothetical protein COB57_02395 [Candidatus Peregrinibacteria bacterium]|nr:MAG: hypothetical protein COB57_02395 [Candidatus Peregrinibacteria bacterium]